MTSHRRNSADRERFAALLISGASLSTAAESLGISRATAQRWKADPIVEEALNEYRREVRAAVTGRLTEFLTLALDRGEELLRNPETPPQTLARLLGLALAESRLWIETEEVVRRLDRLELGPLAAHTDPLEEELRRHEG